MAANQNAPLPNTLVVDVGNQTTCFGLFHGDSLEATWSITTPTRITVDEIKLSISDFFRSLEDSRLFEEEVSVPSGRIESILSCVIPDLTNKWVTALRSVCKLRPLVVGPGLKTGLKMDFNDPAEVGPDRIADIVAAKDRYGYPLVVIDCGFTINYQVLDAEGCFVGGLIVPGLMLSATSLSQAAARLPIVELGIANAILGKNTRESMQSGIIMGEVARITGLIEAIWQELGYETDVVLAGEDAYLLAPLLTHTVHVDETLTLKGLYLLNKINRKPSR